MSLSSGDNRKFALISKSQIDKEGCGYSDWSGLFHTDIEIYMTAENCYSHGDFLEKNNVAQIINLTQLYYPSQYTSKEFFIIGLAAGARALNNAVCEHHRSGNNILLHCRHGKERTPATVTYYLIRYENYDGKETVELVNGTLKERLDLDIEIQSNESQSFYSWLRSKNQAMLIQCEQGAVILSAVLHIKLNRMNRIILNLCPQQFPMNLSK
jgi:hypothetical protein